MKTPEDVIAMAMSARHGSEVIWSEHREAAPFILRALAAEGYAVVPIEPTEAMIDAVLEREETEPIYKTIWQAMVRAA